MGRRNKTGRRLHGILLLDKSSGCSSNHALQRVKRLFNAQKAGHTGSLDPLATGMLPVCFGEATKVSAYLLDADKTYETEARLGVRTNSGDVDGEVVETVPVPGNLTLTQLQQTVARFTGELDQIPPMYSALKIDGQRLYKLARQGISVDRKSRRITIYSIDILNWDADLVSLRVRCSKGTYIRTLIEDIGNALGCGAHVQSLRRESVTPFEDGSMYTQSALEAAVETGGMEALDSLIIPPEQALQGMPQCEIDNRMATLFCQGQSVPRSSAEQTFPSGAAVLKNGESGDLTSGEASYTVFNQGRLLGIGKGTRSATDQCLIQPVRVFNW